MDKIKIITLVSIALISYSIATMFISNSGRMNFIAGVLLVVGITLQVFRFFIIKNSSSKK